MKSSIAHFILILILNLQAFGQTEMPISIKVISYLGGDWRSGEEMGAYDQIDSMTYTLDSKNGYYLSNSIYNIHELRYYKKGKFTKNLNKPSLLKRPVLNVIKTQKTVELVKELDPLNYREEILIDSIQSESNDQMGRDSTRINIALNYNLESFGYSATRFDCLCEPKYPNYSDDLEYDKDSFDSIVEKNFLDYMLKANARDLVITSRVQFFTVIIEYKANSIILIQNNPGDLNITWTIKNKHENTSSRVINPKRNELVYNLTPVYFAQRHALIEYKESSITKFLGQ